MKTEDEINDALGKVDENGPSTYPGMTYEQSVAEALMWVLEKIADEDFEYSNT